RLRDHGKVEGRTQASLAAFKQHAVPDGLEQIGALLEAIDHLVEPDRTATRRHAVPLVLGTSVEVAEPAKIAVADRFDQKHVELLAHHAGAGSALKRSAQRTCSRATERAEAILRIDPERQVEIAAFVPHFDSRTPELGK